MKIQALEREKIFQQFLKEKEMIDEVIGTPLYRWRENVEQQIIGCEENTEGKRSCSTRQADAEKSHQGAGDVWLISCNESSHNTSSKIEEFKRSQEVWRKIEEEKVRLENLEIAKFSQSKEKWKEQVNKNSVQQAQGEFSCELWNF